MTHNDATLNQIRAADPRSSTWLSANAGSGKTRVLTDRVARLLLDGVSPQNILCLTYTKAAASEMQNRLFKRLGEWAMKDDLALSNTLADMGVEGDFDLRLARQLFARAIETPGGLKIQTIHAYCASLLRRFPMEAGVSPQFSEMDERASEKLRETVLERMSDGPHRHYVEALARMFTGEDLRALTEAICKHRTLFSESATEDDVWRWFELPEGISKSDASATGASDDDLPLLQNLARSMAAGGKRDAQQSEQLRSVGLNQISDALRSALERLLLLQRPPYSAKIGSFPSKALREGDCASIMPELEDLMQRVERAKQQRLALLSAQRSLVLHNFAHEFVAAYESAKLDRGWLDFDDLIIKASQLLTDPSVAAWVLYRLDGGIDHILVDEAQDTSPVQWTIIDSLAREFTSGVGARDEVERTLFVVGDPKQSIYSFQGAEPAAFDRMRQAFAQRLSQIGQGLQQLPLEYSFRSSRAILEFVDTALGRRTGLGGEFLHRAFFADMPGRVDLWPALEPVKHDEDRDWNDPVDRPSPKDHRVALAEHIANQISDLLETESIPDQNGDFRPVEASDILILVRSRGALFHEIIRACKSHGIPIAGADQLRISAELAVKDLTALLSFLATPEDDLSLAAVLRSPLFGWGEDQLFRLAHPRGDGTYLWRALSEQAEYHPETFKVLTDLRNAADFQRPYELLERMLTRHDGRRKLLARLGPEAADGIDALLAQAIAYEQLEVPSLTGFLTWLDAGDVTVKRQMDNVGRQVRVMTIHGAKGLEAPIVILPDLAARRASDPPAIATLSGGQAFWMPKADERTGPIEDIAQSIRDAEVEERMRLLYVALTRAESWLILAAAGDLGKSEDGWFRICETAMEGVGAVNAEFPTGSGKRYQTGIWPDPTQRMAVEDTESTVEPPDWLSDRATAPRTAHLPVSPSDLGGAKSLPGEQEFDPNKDLLRHGRQVHLLLEHLANQPQNRWAQITANLLSAGPDRANENEQDSLLAEVSAVLTNPTLASIFAPQNLAEVPVTGALPQLPDRIVHGVIDRLVISDDGVLVVDFKSNQVVPETPLETPEGLLRQLGAYRCILQQIYPDRPVRTAILWTQSCEIMDFDDGLVDAALGRLDLSDLAT